MSIEEHQRKLRYLLSRGDTMINPEKAEPSSQALDSMQDNMVVLVAAIMMKRLRVQ